MSASATTRLLLIDNYDSFTYNLVQAFMVLGADVLVHRNDQITIDAGARARADASVHLARPGHAVRRGRLDADDRSLRRQHAGVRRVSRPSVARRSVRRQSRARRAPDARQDLAGASRRPRHPRRHAAAVRGRALSLADRAAASLPDVLEVSARTDEGEIMGVRHQHAGVEGVQFHPESVLTPEGPMLMGNFLQATLAANARRAHDRAARNARAAARSPQPERSSRRPNCSSR